MLIFYSSYATNLLPSSINKLRIVNISSLCAIQPFGSWSIYCAGKSAREMFHKVAADELKDNTSIKILNYAPGPLDTDMQKEIREGAAVDPVIQGFFKSMKDENKLVDSSESADKLVKLIIADSFVSGAHVDFYDLVDGDDEIPVNIA